MNVKMASTAGRFTFDIITPDEGACPFDARVHLYVRPCGNSENNQLRLSAELMTEGQIDAYIGQLKKDLDHTGKLAKKTLKQANSKTRA